MKQPEINNRVFVKLSNFGYVNIYEIKKWFYDNNRLSIFMKDGEVFTLSGRNPQVLKQINEIVFVLREFIL